MARAATVSSTEVLAGLVERGICRVPDGEFDFLGYTFGRMYSPVAG
jgi:hypothetical protein